ncbi:LLM class flavin-dependent oxidoreductase [Bacillus sp. Marseille-P3800]|uniref:LLM class flavin-dependent oxidoreductase n=1 Tax=Bacillus sp. Marseille-P3800 TaxID=2014782 RepID=UPI000C0849D0|nr:LLM class flavin-dependent oxidoreductase [Bacillus sp. Marseille-P3800]
MRLSILDQVPTSIGKTVEETAQQTVDLVIRAEQLGYERYWFAEHHGTKGLVSSSPELWMATAAAKTSRIRVGSGGVLLPQYSAYKVASMFNQLEVMYPNRIDGGLGRSPGGNERIRRALANGKDSEMDRFWDKVDEVVQWTTNRSHAGMTASPLPITNPSLYILGLGERSATVSAEKGLGFVHGFFIQPDRLKEAHEAYRLAVSDHKDALTAVFVICGEDDAHAESLAKQQDLWLLQTEKGLDSRIPYEMNRQLTVREEEIIVKNRKRMIIGSVDTVKLKLERLAEEAQSDQFLLLTNVFDYKEKRKSFERLSTLLSS